MELGVAPAGPAGSGSTSRCCRRTRSLAVAAAGRRARVAPRGGLGRGTTAAVDPAHRDLRARRTRRARSACEIRTATSRHRDPARPAPRGDRRRDGRRADRDRARRERLRASGRPRWRRWSGRSRPSVPVDHQHIALAGGGRATSSRATMPCFRDTDNLVYGKSEAGGMLFGGYEPNPVARWVDGVPWDHAARRCRPDHERFAQLMEGAVRRFPFLHDAGVVALLCHPDAMTPDGNPLLGPMPGVRGFWTAAGPLAQRLRRRRRHRQDDRRVDERRARPSST